MASFHIFVWLNLGSPCGNLNGLPIVKKTPFDWAIAQWTQYLGSAFIMIFIQLILLQTVEQPADTFVCITLITLFTDRRISLTTYLIPVQYIHLFNIRSDPSPKVRCKFWEQKNNCPIEYSTNYYGSWYPHIPKRKPNTICNKQSLVKSEKVIWNKQTNQFA